MPEGFNDKVKYDDRTSRGWLLPHWLNKLAPDSRRLRETLRAIDAAVCEIEGSAGDSSERLDLVETRLDVIAGQTTEDTEVLDARVDAQNQIHPNLGHNIRNLHRLILGTENNNEKERLQNEKALQEQINTISFTIMHWVVSDSEARERINTRISNLQQTLNDINQSLSEIYDALADTGAMTYKGAKIAASYEIGDMLKDILAGTDDGEICVSEIPDEVKDEIARHEEITAFLNEFFPNRS